MEKRVVTSSVQLLSLDDFEFSIRTYNALKRAGICDVNTLLSFTPAVLRKNRGFGEKSILEIRDRLAEKKLCLSGDLLVTSKMGIELVQELPDRLKHLSAQLSAIGQEVVNITNLIDGIRLAHIDGLNLGN